MPQVMSIEQIREEQTKRSSAPKTIEQIRQETYQRTWRPPTKEEEEITEDWTGFATGAIVAATTMTMGAPAGIIAGGTALLGEAGSMYLGKLAGHVHPVLEAPTQFGAIILSAFTLENWLINKTFKAVPHIPKFWSKEFTLATEKGMLSKQFVESSADIIRKMDMGDKKAFEKMRNILRQDAYQEKMLKTGKQLAKFEKVIKPISEPIEKVLQRLTKKKILDDRDYQHLARIAKEEAVREYNIAFNKTKTNIINKTANEKWQNHEMKDIFDTIVKDGGISSKFKFASPELKEAFFQRHPNLAATKVTTAKLEKIAADFGYFDIDDMVTKIFETPNQSLFRRIASAELVPEFKRIYRDEILVRIADKEADYLFRLHKISRGFKEGELLKQKHVEALRRTSDILPARRVIKEVEALKKATTQLLKIIQKPGLGKEKLIRLRNVYDQKVAEYQAAVKIKKELGLINQRLKYTSGVPSEYGEQLNNLLAPLFDKATKKLDRHMFAFLTEKYKDEVSIGADILIKKYNGLLKNFPFSKRNFMELTYNQAKDLDDFVKVFRFVAKNERYIRHKADKMLITILGRDIYKTAATTAPKIKFLQPRITTTQLERLAESQMNWLARAHRSKADTLNGALAALKRIEAICFQLDGFKTFGRAWKFIFNKTIMAEVAKEQLGRQVFGRYEKIFAAHKAATKIKPTKYWSATSGNLHGHSISKETALFMALNSKNTDNMKAMLEGLGIPKKELLDFIDGALNKADWKLVDDILDSLDELFPVIAKTYKSKTGLTLQKVKGGRYFPILGDRKHFLPEKIDDLFFDTSDELFRARVKDTFTKIRMGKVKAVRLNFNGLTQHLSDVVHYTTHWEPISEIQRLTKSADFKSAVESTMGTEIYAQFDPWLKNLARPSVTKIDRVMGKARRNVTFASLAFVPKIAAKQFLSFITAMPEVGYVNSMKALNEVIHDPFTMLRAIKEASPEMAYRAKTWNRDFVEMMAEFSPVSKQNRMQRIGFTMIHKVDEVTSSIVWRAGYRKGLQVFDGNADQAVNFANKMVRETQPASAPKDLPAVMRSGEGWRAVTMFFSYWSVYYGQQATAISKGLAGYMTPMQCAGTLAWLAIAPAIAQQVAKYGWNALTGREQEEEHAKELAKGVAMNVIGGTPGVRDLGSAIVRDYQYQISPLMMGFEETVDVSEAIKKIFDDDQELNQYDGESITKLISYFRLMPSKQMITAVNGAVRLYESETEDWSELIDRPPYEKK